MTCIGPIKKPGIKKQSKEKRLNQQTKKRKGIWTGKCVPRAHFVLLLTTAVGLMYGIILPVNCDLISAVMALPAHIVALLEHILAVTEHSHNNATFPTKILR